MRSSKHPTALSLVALAVLLLATSAWTCPYSIRDAGFIVRDPQPYKLTILVRGSEPPAEGLESWLAAAGRKVLADSNIEPEFVDLAKQPDHPAKEYFDKLPQKDLPCALLISPRGSFLRMLPTGGKWTPETVEDLARRAVSSPQRDEIAQHLVSSWCLVVMTPGGDEVENQRVMQAIAEARAQVKGFHTEMGAVIEEPPWVTRVFCGDAEEEVLRWSLGLDDCATEARVAILWGVGRRLGPILSGDKLTATNLAACFKLLGENCTCTADPRSFLGPCVPLAWTKAQRQEVRDRLGFDPEAPEARNSLAGVWTTLESGKVTGGDALPDPGAGYIEFPVEPGGEQPPAPEGGGPQANLNLPWEQRGLRVAAMVGGGIAVAASGSTAALLILRRRRA